MSVTLLELQVLQAIRHFPDGASADEVFKKTQRCGLKRPGSLVSRALGALAREGLAARETREGNKKKSYFSLTRRGEIAILNEITIINSLQNGVSTRG
jgi:DNA-binding MarR family transcriptional regulator